MSVSMIRRLSDDMKVKMIKIMMQAVDGYITVGFARKKMMVIGVPMSVINYMLPLDR